MIPFPLTPPRPSPTLPASDYIIKEKTVLLQKKDSEGFGFVLRGAKGECRPGRAREKGSLTQGDGQGKGPPPTSQEPSPDLPTTPPRGAGPSATVRPP